MAFRKLKEKSRVPGIQTELPLNPPLCTASHVIYLHAQACIGFILKDCTDGEVTIRPLVVLRDFIIILGEVSSG